MAIYSLNHRWVGKTTHEPRTAGAHVRYITRPEAATCVLAERMPSDPLEARAWIDHQENTDRKNARVIDKVMIALPLELDHEQRVELARDFAETMSQGRASWILGIHDGPEDADNPHAHIIFRDRDFETGKRVMQLSEMGGTERLRITWEERANAALERAGHDARIDRRSLEAQGIDREAQIHVGPNARELERQGERPESAQREQTRHVYGEHLPIIIEYPDIDDGRTRHEENEERKARNRAREAVSDLHWATTPGMVAQQHSAMQWVKAAHEQRQAEAEQGQQAEPPQEPIRDAPEREQSERYAETTDRKQKDEERQKRDEAVDAMIAKRRAEREAEREGGREM